MCALVAVVLWAALGSPDRRQHHLGQSTPTRATVTDVAAGGTCRGNMQGNLYTLTWAEGGRQRVEGIRRCGDDYEVGQVIEIWSTSGMPYTESPRVWQLFIGGLCAAFLGMALAMLVGHLRLRRNVRAVLGGAAPAAQYPMSQVSPDWLPFRRTIHPMVRDEIASFTPTSGWIYPSELGRGGRPRRLTLHVSGTGSRSWVYA